jgi:MFS family permease
MFIVSLVINMIGNLIYALAYYADSWEMILIGRLVSGIGATALPLIMVYISDNFAKDEQTSAIGYIKYIAAISRVMGPIMGSIFSITVDDDGGIVTKLFNLYTLVGWIPILMCIITLIILIKYFDENVQNNLNNNNQINVGTEQTLWNTIHHFFPIQFIGFLSTFIYWLFMGNAFIITTHHYHLIDNEHELGNIYITGLVGFILAFGIFFFKKKEISTLSGLGISMVLLTLGSYVYLSDDNWTFYLAVGVSTFAYGIMIPSINIINNQLAKSIKADSNSNMAIQIILLHVSQSIGRFLGPSALPVFTELNEEYDCNFDDQDKYITDGCTIDNYVASTAFLVSFSFVIMVISLYVLHKKMARLENGLLANSQTTYSNLGNNT